MSYLFTSVYFFLHHTVRPLSLEIASSLKSHLVVVIQYGLTISSFALVAPLQSLDLIERPNPLGPPPSHYISALPVFTSL